MNRLSSETSPYLLQHADNPVDWYPWGDEAFARAKREGKPVLLSVGYSACHWCHVMAHESFEDDDVAAAMNRDFVNVKVDREERPDVDQIYQTAHALMTRRSGGWPLTVFMTPAGEPFFAGTYFPKRGRQGLPGLVDLLPHVARVYREKGEAIAAQGDELRRALASLEPEAWDGDVELPAAASRSALADLRSTFDAQHGGFGKAPKFPHVADLEFALERHLRDGAAGALEIAQLTARRMADGGIHDQLGGGFCRYAVDREWQIPHFEKMLYDNGPLLGLYADLATVTGDGRFREAAEGIVTWLAREMRAPDGGLYSSLDADSEGEEGRYYVWSVDEVRSVLDAGEFEVASATYGLDAAANFEGRAWHLRFAKPVDEAARELGLDAADAHERLASAKRKLFAARAKRVRPGLDDKILASWNALAIAGLARAARRLGRADWVDMATTATDALRRTQWRDGRLLATRRGERAHLNAYLDDHAFLLVALDELMQTRFRLADYAWAREIAETLLARFEDPQAGAFFFTSHDHEPLIHRPKPGHDNATPSGNGAAARALVALGQLAGEMRYVEAAERVVRLFAPQYASSPRGFSTMISALDDVLSPPAVVLLAGDPGVTQAWHASLARLPTPAVRIYDVRDTDLPSELRKGATTGTATAWVCRGGTCLPPMSTLADVQRELQR